MNIEEDSIPEAIRMAGKKLGHLHIGEANRRPPHDHGRIPWREIGSALREIGYDGAVVMEPFVRMEGQIGRDIRIWRDMSEGCDDSQLDREVAASLAYLKTVFEM
jgi:D-psicose/D-tagatose/L-ribulose 3-epimerase